MLLLAISKQPIHFALIQCICPQHSLSVGLVTSLAANNAKLQSNLVKNGVLWSLLLFLFDYDYTLDESGVKTDEKSNQQKSLNNLARMSILAIVAVCGYDLKLILDESDPLNAAIRYNSATTPTGTVSGNSSVKASAQSSPSSTTASTYTSNATNLIQNNAIHAMQMNNNTAAAAAARVVGAAVEKISDGEEVFESDQTGAAGVSSAGATVGSVAVEKENFANNRKYTVAGTPTNLHVKKIVDRLLTKYITDKFATHSDSEVLKLLTSNTRNPYVIWDNATRTQLIDFLEYQRTKSAKEQYEDVADIVGISNEFSFDAHK